MKVSLAKHGGYAAGMRIRQPAAELDAADLDASRQRELMGLIDAASKSQAPETQLRPMPDAMSYTVTIDGDGGPIVLRGVDGETSPEFDALLSWLHRNLPTSPA